MERAHRQQSNLDYWEQAQNLRPLDIAARAEMLADEDKTQEAYAEFERSLKEVAKRYGNPSPQLELTRRRFITFCWSQHPLYAEFLHLSKHRLQRRSVAMDVGQEREHGIRRLSLDESNPVSRSESFPSSPSS